MAIIVRDHRGGNWFWVHNTIVTEYGPQLGAYGIAIYAALCCHAGQDQVTWVGQKAIAAAIGCSRAQVQKELGKLKELGLLAVDEQVDERGRTTNLYTLLAPPATEEAPRLPQRQGGLPERQPPPSTEAGPPVEQAAMINKTHGTRLMEQGLSKGRPPGQTTTGPNGRGASAGSAKTRKRDTPAGAYLAAVLTDYSRELHDEAHAAANITRAARLQRTSGLEEREFVEVVHAARTMTRARGNIRKAADGDPALRNRMPYFFAVLEDLLAREEEPAEDQEEDARPAGRGWTPEDAERFASGPYGRLVQG